MIICEKLFESFCPSYKKVIEELESKIAESEKNDDELIELIIPFTKKYLTPWQILKLYERAWYREDLNNMHMEFLFDETEPCIQNQADLKELDNEMLAFHFFHNGLDIWSPEQSNNSLSKLLKFYFPMYSNNIKGLSYPHSALKKCWQQFEKTSSKSIPKQVYKDYKKMEEMYNRIIEANADVEEWFKLICETNDDIFIRHNSMYRLGSNLNDKKLWNLYIEYLRNCDPSEMLQIYSRYCRFFLDDFEMKEKYQNEAKKYGHPVIVPWENVFEFEEMLKKVDRNVPTVKRKTDADIKTSALDRENELREFYENIYEIYCKPDNNVPSNVETIVRKNQISNTPGIVDGCDISNFYRSVSNQKFPFRNSFMSYILKNANPAILNYLQQTCKYFVGIKSIIFCYKLETTDIESYFEKESLFFDYENGNIECLKHLYIATTFKFESYHSVPKTFVSNIIPKLYKCDAKYINIYHQILSFDALKFLIESGNIIEIEFEDVEVTNNDEIVFLEEITQFLPNVEKLSLTPVHLSRNTVCALHHQIFCCKISSFILGDIFGEPFDCEEFVEFCKKIRDKVFWLSLQFSDNFADVVQLFILLKQCATEIKDFKFNLNGRTNNILNYEY